MLKILPETEPRLNGKLHLLEILWSRKFGMKANAN
jgi:hypothetical protein